MNKINRNTDRKRYMSMLTETLLRLSLDTMLAALVRGFSKLMLKMISVAVLNFD